MVDLTNEEFDAASRRGEGLLRASRDVSARYDAERDRVIVRLTSGVEIGFAPNDAEGLQGATAADLGCIEVKSFGLGIHFPKLNADFYVPALLQGCLGSPRWMQSRLEAVEAQR